MKFKVLLVIFALFVTTANAADGKYTLTYQQQNKWVAQKDIKPLRNAVVFFQNNNLKIKATCSEKDIFCQQRVELINHVFKTQKVKQPISVVEKSKYIPTNKIIVESINVDKNKYSNLFINYTAKNIQPVTKSQADVKSFLKYAELKYLSKFKMYCKTVDSLCKERFKALNSQFGKTLTFKYNFALYQNSNLAENQAQLIAHRHDYAIHKPVEKPVTTAKKIKKEKSIPKAKKKDYSVVYSKEKNIIVFKENSSNLELLERIKVEKLIENSPNNTFKFACGKVSDELCQARVHTIKNYALKNTNSIIIMEQFKHKIYRDYVLIINKK